MLLALRSVCCLSSLHSILNRQHIISPSYLGYSTNKRLYHNSIDQLSEADLGNDNLVKPISTAIMLFDHTSPANTILRALTIAAIAVFGGPASVTMLSDSFQD